MSVNNRNCMTIFLTSNDSGNYRVCHHYHKLCVYVLGIFAALDTNTCGNDAIRIINHNSTIRVKYILTYYLFIYSYFILKY